MTKRQFIEFLKAPFSKGFLLLYMLTFLSLLAVPLCSTILNFLLENIKTIETLSDEEVGAFVLNALQSQLDMTEVWLALIGCGTAWLGVSVYAFLLTHKTMLSNPEVFHAAPVCVSFGEFMRAVLKWLGYCLVVLLGLCVVIVLTLLAIALTAIGAIFVSKILGLLLGIAAFIFFFYLLYKVSCYILTFNVVFFREYKLSSFFCYGQIRRQFIGQRRQIYILFLFSFVLTQIVYAVCSTIGFNVLKGVVFASGMAHALSISNVLPIVLGILLWNLISVYLTLLQAVVWGKMLLWAEGAQK